MNGVLRQPSSQPGYYKTPRPPKTSQKEYTMTFTLTVSRAVMAAALGGAILAVSSPAMAKASSPTPAGFKKQVIESGKRSRPSTTRGTDSHRDRNDSRNSDRSRGHSNHNDSRDSSRGRETTRDHSRHNDSRNSRRHSYSNSRNRNSRGSYYRNTRHSNYSPWWGFGSSNRGYRNNYRSSIGISFLFGNDGYSRHRWSPSAHNFYRSSYGAFHTYANQTYCERVLVQARHNGHYETVSVKQCSNPWDGTYIIQGSERLVHCRG